MLEDTVRQIELGRAKRRDSVPKEKRDKRKPHSDVSAAFERAEADQLELKRLKALGGYGV
jgi:hypothetical protein